MLIYDRFSPPLSPYLYSCNQNGACSSHIFFFSFLVVISSMPNATLPAFILNIIALSNSFITTLICLIILIILILGRFYKKDVHLLLCTNTYVSILAYSLASGSLYIDTLRGDIQSKYEMKSLSLCRIRGSLVLALFSAIFGAFSLQAFFRLCRVTYGQHKNLQKYHIQLVFILIKWLFSFTFVWLVEIDYLPTEYYCSIPFHTLKPALLASVIAYGCPSSMIALFYIRIILYIRSKGYVVSMQRHTRRDVKVIRRIVMTVSSLWLLGIPSMILLLYGQIHGGIIHPLTYRIEWIAPSFALAVLSVFLIKCDPYLIRVLFPKRSRKHKAEKSDSYGTDTQTNT